MPEFSYFRRQPRGVNVLTLNGIPTGFTGDGSSGIELSGFPIAGSTFAITTSFRQTAGASGYIFAKTNRAGSIRYYGLYSARNGQTVDFFYTDANRVVRRERFPAAVADGLRHEIQIMIRKATVNATILFFKLDDGAAIIRQLGYEILPDCDANVNSNDCILAVGKRRAVNTRGGRFFFSGIIFDLHIFPSSAEIAALNNVHRATAVNLLPDVTQFDGLTGISSTGNIFISRGVTVNIDLLQIERTNGYIFAKTDQSGALRYIALFSSSQRANGLRLYYTVGGRTRRTTFSYSVSDGSRHTVMLHISDSTAALSVDGSVSNRQSLVGPPEDCGLLSAECILKIGDRSPGRFRFEGTIYSITVTPHQ